MNRRRFFYSVITSAILVGCAGRQTSLVGGKGIEVKIVARPGILQVHQAAVYEEEGGALLKGSVRRSAYSSARAHVDVRVTGRDGVPLGVACSGSLLQPARKGSAEMPFRVTLPARTPEGAVLTVALHTTAVRH